MNKNELVKKNFERLVKEGREIISKCGWDGTNFSRFPQFDEYLRFRTEAMNLLRRSCGEDSDHYRELRRIAGEAGSFYIIHCIGIVEAAQRDFDMGLLFDLRKLIAAELLGDFIDQAESLLAGGYFVPAASLAGAVLEDTLRKLCEKHAIPVPSSTKIDTLNNELARAGVYDKLIQKRITAIADIRNNADHGQFKKFKREDVEDMVKWVRGFAADFLK
jgi:hypothetical protein